MPDTSSTEDLRGKPLGPQELEALRAYARTGVQKLAAVEMGLSLQTIKNYLYSVYRKLDVTSAVDAFRVLGWLRIPPNEELAALAAAARIAAIRVDLDAIAAEVRSLTDALPEPDRRPRVAA